MNNTPKKPELSADLPPTANDFRTAARVLRWSARTLDDAKNKWPWWKRILKEYEGLNLLRTQASKFEEMADLIESSPQKIVPSLR